MTPDSPFAKKLSAIPVQRHEILVLGSRTAYWVYGDPNAETTVTITHGYRGEHHGLEPVIAQLPGVRFIAPDLPGFGESTPMTEASHSINGYAQWLGTFIDAIGLAGKTVVLGHSFGTIVSSAALAAGLVTPALILINPISVGGLDGPRPIATRLTVWYYSVAQRLPQRLGLALLRSPIIVQFMSMSLVKTKRHELRRWIHREHHTYFSRFSDRNTVVEAFRASLSHNVSDFAAGIRVPTLLIAADRDDITPVSAHPAVVEAIGDARLVVLTDVGHLIHYEKPEEAATAIDGFLSAQRDSGESIPAE